MSKVETILEEIKGLTLLEASDLVKKMEETFGVSAAAATVVAAGGGAAAGGAAPAEEKTEFSVVLTDVAATRSTSLKRSAKSPASASKKPRIWWMALRRPLRKASTRTKPLRSRRSLKRPAPRSRSSSLPAPAWPGHTELFCCTVVRAAAAAPKEFAYASRDRYLLQTHGPSTGPPQPCVQRSRAGRFARR